MVDNNGVVVRRRTAARALPSHTRIGEMRRAWSTPERHPAQARGHVDGLAPGPTRNGPVLGRAESTLKERTWNQTGPGTTDIRPAPEPASGQGRFLRHRPRAVAYCARFL